MNENRVGGLIC